MVERLFLENRIRILCTTSTLAVGVNLPAHLVVIKSTQRWSKAGYEEYSVLDMLQMIGRAGRPQFDTKGVAVIMTTYERAAEYRRLVAGSVCVESSLHKRIMEHINAEIVLRYVWFGLAF